MIELSFSLGDNIDVFKAIQWYNNLFAWLLTELEKKSEESKGWLSGYLILHDVASNTVGSLILTSKEASELEILNLVQQPPGEHKEKYQAHIVSKTEPVVVTEQPPEPEKKEEVTAVKRSREPMLNEDEDLDLEPMKMEIDES